MARKRPTVLTVMGILNIVIGGLFLLCNLCVGIFALAFLGMSEQGGPLAVGINPIRDWWTFMQAEVPGFAVITLGELVVNFVLFALLIVAGIGLLNVQNWARVLSIAYGILTILVKIGILIYTLAILNPATERWQQDFFRRHVGGAAAPPGLESSPMNNVFQLFGTVLGMTYAIVLIIMMLLPSVSAAFAGHYRPEGYDLDREDEDDLGRERRPREEWRE